MSTEFQFAPSAPNRERHDAAYALKNALPPQATRPFPQADKAMIAEFNANAGQRLAYLAGRWADESEYEDWTEYVDEMMKLAPTGATITRCTKRPVGFEFTHAGVRYTARAKVGRTRVTVNLIINGWA